MKPEFTGVEHATEKYYRGIVLDGEGGVYAMSYAKNPEEAEARGRLIAAGEALRDACHYFNEIVQFEKGASLRRAKELAALALALLVAPEGGTEG